VSEIRDGLSVKAIGARQSGSVRWSVPVVSGASVLQVSGARRSQDVVAGEQRSEQAYVAVLQTAKDAVKKWTAVAGAVGTEPRRSFSRIVWLSDEVQEVRIVAGFYRSAGVFELDSVQVRWLATIGWIEALIGASIVGWGVLFVWSVALMLGVAPPRFQVLAGLLLTVTLLAVLLPADAIAALNEVVTSVIGHEPPASTAGIPSDKIVHFAMFFSLGAVLVLARPDLSMLRILSELSALGAATEILQSYVPGRSTSLEDLLADALGATVGMILSRRFFDQADCERAGAL
jgi:VanZ family protein